MLICKSRVTCPGWEVPNRPWVAKSVTINPAGYRTEAIAHRRHHPPKPCRLMFAKPGQGTSVSANSAIHVLLKRMDKMAAGLAANYWSNCPMAASVVTEDNFLCLLNSPPDDDYAVYQKAVNREESNNQRGRCVCCSFSPRQSAGFFNQYCNAPNVKRAVWFHCFEDYQ